jgi:tripartite-type tricarboxylate transporter receptor subunit TctC
MTGRIPLMFDTLSSALPQVRAGTLKLVAVVSDEPVRGEPDLPILTGLLPRGAMVGWNGIVVPAKTPRPVVAKLNTDFIEAVQSSAVQNVLAPLHVQTITTTPEDFDAFIAADIGRWAAVLRRAGIAPGSLN